MTPDDELMAMLIDALDDGPPPAPTDDSIEHLRSDFARHQSTTRPRPGNADRGHDRRVEHHGGRRPRERRWNKVAMAAAAVVVVASLGFAAGRLGASDRDPTTGGTLEFVEVLASADNTAGAEVSGWLTGIGRVLVINTDELPILPTGEYYEVWFVGPGDSPSTPNRISAGTFHPDSEGVTAVTLSAAVNPVLFPVLVVTAEPGDGDPAPSDVEVLRTTLSPLTD